MNHRKGLPSEDTSGAMLSRAVFRSTRSQGWRAGRKGYVGVAAQLRASPLGQTHWKRSFSSGKDNEAFADLLKKMQGNDKMNQEEEEGSKVTPEPEDAYDTEGEKEREVADDEATDETGKHSEEETTMSEEELKEKDEKEGEGMKFEMPSFDPEEIKKRLTGMLDFEAFKENVREAFDELKGDHKTSKLRAKVHQADSYRRAAEKAEEGGEEDGKEEEEKAKGPSAMVHVKDPVSQWDVMKERLSNAPLIRDILKGSKKAYRVAADTDVGQKVEDAADRLGEKLEDAKEFWETSQNPIVYTLSGVWDNMTGETEEGICIKEILKLDPGFDKEEWSDEVRSNLVPIIIKAHLTGDIELLGEHLGEGVLNKLTQDIKLREDDKIEFDANILDIDENQLEMKYREDIGPVVVCVYMVQQINCIRKKGEIIEGSETDVVAKFYSIALTQEYLEEDGEVRWKIVDYEFGGETPYL